VNAREKLFHVASGDMPVTGDEVNEAIDAYAHELAEKILSLRDTVPDLRARQAFKDGYDGALLVAAYTIAPEGFAERPTK